MGAFDGRPLGDLAGRVAFITGASSGIGRALALELARQGADLVVTARRLERLTEVAAAIQALGRRALALRADVTRDGDVEAALAATRDAFGHVDIVVANAGFSVTGPLDTLALDDYRRQFETNVFGVLRTALAARADLAASRGRLVVMGSVAGWFGGPRSSPYVASKFAVRGLTESLDHELATLGVSVTHVSPGFVESDIRRTDRFGVLHPGAPDTVPAWLVMSAERAARIIARGVRRRRHEVIVTGHARVAVLLARWAPGLLRALLRRAPRPEPPKG